jgi:hypothetical protein
MSKCEVDTNTPTIASKRARPSGCVVFATIAAGLGATQERAKGTPVFARAA